MTIQRINPDSLAEPSGFTHAVSATGNGLVFLAGQTAQGRDGSIVGDGVAEQFEQALSNLLAAARAAGAEPQHLVRVTVYATDPADYRANSEEIGRIWRKQAGSDYPAMALIGVSGLWDERALVELDGIAVRPWSGRHHG